MTSVETHPSGFATRRTLIRTAGCALGAFLLPVVSRAQTTGPQAAAGATIVLRAEEGAIAAGGAERPAAPVWGFGAVTPGPLLRVTRGEPLNVTLLSHLPKPTAVHWHGLRIPNGMDGAPPLTQASVMPGETCAYRFSPPDAGTFWYHAPFSMRDPEALGLCGPLIVDEAEPVPVGRDLVLGFSVWHPRPDGRPDAAAAPHVTANGRSRVAVVVRSGEWLRLRLLNMSRHLLAARLEGHRATVAAIDGQPAEPYEARDARVVVGPGNRIDLFVEAERPPGAKADLFVDIGAGEVPIARLTYADGPPSVTSRHGPPRLPRSSLPERMDFAGALKLDLALDEQTAGSPSSQAPGADRPAAAARRGRTVMLGLVNRGGRARAVHIHGHHFRLLDRLDDGWKPFWLDTIVVPPKVTERIAFVADNPGRWMIEHFAIGGGPDHSWTWFEVT